MAKLLKEGYFMNELQKYLNTTNIEDLHESQIANFLKDLKDEKWKEEMLLKATQVYIDTVQMDEKLYERVNAAIS